jgi:hypothetical protein
MSIMLPPTKLGWMAGIIDLKGRFVRKENKLRATPQIVLFVESKEIPVIKELGVLTGISVEFQKSSPLKDFMRRGCSEHCPEAHFHVADERLMPANSRWTITGAAMAVVLFNIIPFLILDKGYQEIYDEVIKNTPLAGQGSGAVVASIRRLNLLGWELPTEYEIAME